MSNKLTKNTNNDKSRILSDKIERGYLLDFDDDFVYWEMWTDDGRKTMKAAYTFDGTSADIDEDSAVEVVRLTEYAEVESDDDSVVDKVLHKLLNHFGGSNKESPVVIKDLNEEEMIAVEPLWVPNGVLDGQDEFADEDGIYDLVKSVNEKIEDGTLEANYFHKFPTDHFHFIKAWINPCDRDWETLH